MIELVLVNRPNQRKLQNSYRRLLVDIDPFLYAAVVEQPQCAEEEQEISAFTELYSSLEENASTFTTSLQTSGDPVLANVQDAIKGI